MISRFPKYQVATVIAIVFHVIGIVGILYFDKSFFIQSTPFNLLLMFCLLCWTQKEKNQYFLLFLILSFLIGIIVEIIGVSSAILFGSYYYGDVLGYKLAGVPVVIGINWFIIIYCCGICTHTLLMKTIKGIALHSPGKVIALKVLSIIAGAILAVFFDWIMEPVAVKLGYWNWKDSGNIPFFNYVCWFMVSVLLLTIFHFLPFSKNNKFGINLLLIQLIFFLLLRSVL